LALARPDGYWPDFASVPNRASNIALLGRTSARLDGAVGIRHGWPAASNLEADEREINGALHWLTNEGKIRQMRFADGDIRYPPAS
jgi:hypothetical protein